MGASTVEKFAGYQWIIVLLDYYLLDYLVLPVAGFYVSTKVVKIQS